MPALAESDLRADYVFPWFDSSRETDFDRVAVANPGPARATVAVTLQGRSVARLDLDPGQAATVRVPETVAGPMLLRGRDPADPGRPVPIVAALHGGGEVHPLARLMPPLALDSATSAVDFPWSGLAAEGEQEYVVVANPGAEPAAFVVMDGQRTLVSGVLAADDSRVERLTPEQPGPIGVYGFAPRRTSGARPIFAAKRVLWQGVLGEIAGISRPADPGAR